MITVHAGIFLRLHGHFFSDADNQQLPYVLVLFDFLSG